MLRFINFIFILCIQVEAAAQASVSATLDIDAFKRVEYVEKIKGDPVQAIRRTCFKGEQPLYAGILLENQRRNFLVSANVRQYVDEIQVYGSRNFQEVVSQLLIFVHDYDLSGYGSSNKGFQDCANAVDALINNMVDYSHAWRVFYSKPHIRDAASRSEDAERLWRGEAVRSLEVNMATGSLDEISDRLQNDLLDQNRAFQKERRYLLDFMQQFDRLATTVDQSVKKGTEPSESDKNEIAKVYLKAIAIQNNHKCFFDSDIARLLSEDRKLDGNQRKFRDLRLNIHQYVRGVLNTCKSAARNFGVISGKYLNSDFSTADVMREYNKIVASYREGVRLIRTEYSENNDDLSNNRRPRHSALTRLRSAAKADVIAQVLNYSAGLPEDASGGIFFYPIQNTSDQCTYKIAVDEASPWASISKEMLLSVEQVGLDAGINELNNPFNQIIDLKKPNLANINFYSLRGVKRNKFTGAVGTLRYQSRIEGLPDLFECDSNSCNLERLGRGWALVRDKCKGTTKPF